MAGGVLEGMIVSLSISSIFFSFVLSLALLDFEENGLPSKFYYGTSFTSTVHKFEILYKIKAAHSISTRFVPSYCKHVHFSSI